MGAPHTGEGVVVKRMDPLERVFVSDEEYERRRFGCEVKRSWATYLSRVRVGFLRDSNGASVESIAPVVAFRGYVRHLTRVAQQPVCYFVIVETGRSGVAHWHALLWGTARVKQMRLEPGQLPGLARAAANDETRGAAAYVTKEIEKSADEWTFSEKLPPLRALKTRVFPGTEVAAAPTREETLASELRTAR